MWTLAYRKRNARWFRRVTNWSGTWEQAREVAALFAKACPELQVYHVPSRRAEQAGKVCAEDIGSVLADSGRRVPYTENGTLSDEILAQVPDATKARDRWIADAI